VFILSFLYFLPFFLTAHAHKQNCQTGRAGRKGEEIAKIAIPHNSPLLQPFP
jgi:hypothetical protein